MVTEREGNSVSVHVCTYQGYTKYSRCMSVGELCMIFRQDPKLHGLDNIQSLLVHLLKLTSHEVSHLSRPD